MAMIPAITTGITSGSFNIVLQISVHACLLFTIKSGLSTPIAETPTPALAVPYAAPKHVKTIAAVQPIAPKNGYIAY